MGEELVSYLCVGAIQYEDATQYHRRFEVVVAKGNHNERDLELHKIPNAYTRWLNADISVVLGMIRSMGISKRCCVLCIAGTHALVVGDRVLFNVHVCRSKKSGEVAVRVDILMEG